MDGLAKVLMVVGAVVLAFGALLWVGARLGLGSLPGDFSFKRGNVSIYVPLTTCVVISLLVTLILRLLRH